MATTRSVRESGRHSSWRGVLLVAVGGVLLGPGAAIALIGVGLLAFTLDRIAPQRLDQLIDFLTF